MSLYIFLEGQSRLAEEQKLQLHHFSPETGITGRARTEESEMVELAIRSSYNDGGGRDGDK